MSEKLLGIPQVARELNRDQSTINRWLAAGKITAASYVGNRALFTSADVAALKRGEQHLRQETNSK